MTSLKHINLSDNAGRGKKYQDEFLSFCNFLSSLDSLITLNLGDIGLEKIQVEILLESLNQSDFNQLNCLDLSYAPFNYDFETLLLQVLVKLPSLRKLNLEGTCLQKKNEFIQFVQKRNTKLQIISDENEEK